VTEAVRAPFWTAANRQLTVNVAEKKLAGRTRRLSVHDAQGREVTDDMRNL